MEKHGAPSYGSYNSAASTSSTSSFRIRALAFIALCLIALAASCRHRLQSPPVRPASGLGNAIITDFESEAIAQDLVPLEAHIMSKCPDARDALRELIVPAMSKISDKVSFKLTYIGTPTQNGGIECKHGPEECMGNILELCAAELYPDPKIYLGFVMCLSKDFRNVPQRSLVEDCALEHAIDMDALNGCATKDDGAHGMDLLRASVTRSAELGVTVSCTIRLNGHVYCIRGDGEWYDCPSGPGVDSLTNAVERLYQQIGVVKQDIISAS